MIARVRIPLQKRVGQFLNGVEVGSLLYKNAVKGSPGQERGEGGIIFRDRRNVGKRVARRVRKGESSEVRELQRRIRELEQENEFLKKASAFFAANQA